jgi:hypothetical protein
MTRARIAALVAACAVAGCGGGGGGRAIKVEGVAARHAAERLHLRGFAVTASKGSRVDRRWVLVAGFAKLGPGGRPGPVAIWLTRDGRSWKVRRSGVDARGRNPVGVPCDLRPAFARPAC